MKKEMIRKGGQRKAHPQILLKKKKFLQNGKMESRAFFDGCEEKENKLFYNLNEVDFKVSKENEGLY